MAAVMVVPALALEATPPAPIVATLGAEEFHVTERYLEGTLPPKEIPYKKA
jgi:hypothetical protein